MTSQPTTLPGVLLLKPNIFPDARGIFYESYNKETMKSVGITDDFIQDSVSVSKKNVLRGLHFQKPPFAQAKLVSVVKGKVFDVAVDLREGSPTYAKWVGILLDDEHHDMLYIPQGFAHGFFVLSDEAIFSYKISGSTYHKPAASGIVWNDPTIQVAWPISQGEPLLSEQDRSLPQLQA